MNDKKVVLITGAAKGIGKATTLKFAAAGFSLALADNDHACLNDLERELKTSGYDCLCLAGDISDAEYLKAIVSKSLTRWGRIDVLVNNAAWRTVETMRTISTADWNRTVSVCLTAPAFLSKYVAAAMEERKMPGVIINISSVMSQRAGGTSPAYVACKGALESLTNELAVLYGPKAIRVITVKPGNIQSGLSSDYRNDKGENISTRLENYVTDLTPLGRAGSPEDVASVCYWLSTDEASYITGTSIMVDGGLAHNFNPYSVKKIQFPKQF